MSEREKNDQALVKAASECLPVTAETVKRYINEFATGQEVSLFLNQCAMFGLNPFKREIYLIKYSAGEKASFVVGYEVYLKRADRTDKWAGMESGTQDDKEGRPFIAWAKVYRKDWPKPLYHEVYFEEYAQYKDEYVWKDGRKTRTGKRVLTRFWAEKPRTMLKKVAIAQAFRMAFPDEFGGMPYTAEEMPIDHASLPKVEVVVEAEPGGAPPAAKPLERVKDEWDPGPDKPVHDLMDPKVNPFSKPAAKSEEVHDPTPAGDPDVDLQAEAKEPAGPPSVTGPSMVQLEKFAKIKLELLCLGINEETLWEGIHRFTEQSFGRVAVETSDYSEMEMELVLGYMGRWRGALKAKAEKEAAEAKGKKS